MIDVYDPVDVDMIAISDLHLGRSNVEMILEFAEMWIPRVRQKILLLGDIFDLQVAGTELALQAGSRLAWQVMATKQLLCNIVYLSGNHDERMSEILHSGGDVKILDGSTVQQITPSLYATHGQQYDKANKYLFDPLDKVNFLGSKWLAKIYRKMDRRTGRGDIQYYRDRVREEVRKLPPNSMFIHGHTHTPHDYGIDNKGRRAIDLGSAVHPPNEITFAVKIRGLHNMHSAWETYTWVKK